MSRDYDLVVVGAGIVGLACAWRAAQSGLDVLCLDREGPAAGASGVAAGMLAPVTEADFGEQELLELNTESRGLWRGFAAELEELTGMSTGYEERGALVVAADRDDAEELRRLQRFQAQLGLGSRWLGPRAARALEPGLSPRVAGAIDAPQDAQVDPGAVVAALARAFRDAGGQLRTETVTELDGLGHQVVVAAGAWSGQFEGAPAVRPVKGQLLELRARGAAQTPAHRIVRSPRVYVVSRADGRMIVGATTEEQGFDTTVTADGVFRLLEAAYEVLPDVAELELVNARAGLRPVVPDNRPVIGAREGRLWATGHGRNGVLLAPLTANRIVAEVKRCLV